MRLSTLLATLGLALVLALNLSAQSVRVIFVSGKADIQRPEEPALRPAVKGETVIIGTRIVTGPDGRVVLTPMPGVKSIITPNTTLLLESSSETRTSPTEVTHQAVLELREGAVVSDLQKPEGVTYDYSIRTARGLAGARGTTFTVGINAAGIQTIVVTSGTITINFTDGRQATLTNGRLSLTKADGDTQTVDNIGELSAEDQAAAQAWTEATVNAIAEAIDAGIELDSSSLNEALDAAKALGISLSTETQATVDRVIKTLREKADETNPLMSVLGETKDNENTEVVTENTPDTTPDPDPTPLQRFRARLTADQQTSFDALPSDIQGQLVTLDDLDLAGIALAPDRETGVPLTHEDLRVHLAAFIRLSDEALAFVKTLAGPHLVNLDYTPDPAQWSPAAFERTLASWNALSAEERTLVKNLGAGEAIMDTGKDYISALLDSLTPTQQNLIIQTGWGADLADLAGKPTGENLFNFLAEEFDSGALAAIKFFEISPDNLTNYSSLYIIEALAEVSPANQKILLQLGIADVMLDSIRYSSSGITVLDSPTPDYAARISNALSFYASLTADEKTAVRALGLGYLLYHYAPADTLGESSTTALQKLQSLVRFYYDHPSFQQALQETGLLDSENFLNNPDAIDVPRATATLNAYLNLPERTRTYLLTQDHSYHFFDLANPDTFGEGSSPYRTLAQINTLLASLSAAEFATLLDLDLAKAVIETGTGDYRVTNGYLGTSPGTTLKATLAYFNGLPRAQKFVLRELGIIGDANIALIGADSDGLDRLLAAYAGVSGSLRVATEQLQESHAYYSTYGSDTGTARDRSFFFPSGFDRNYTMENVRFLSTGDLHVGATRYLRINNSMLGNSPTFVVGEDKRLFLHAADLIDLTSTGFNTGTRSITMAAHTINLSDIIFPEYSVISLNSKNGGINFVTHANNVFVPGTVNFKHVTYGSSGYLESQQDLTSQFGARGNIAIGTLKNPAGLPIYTPKPPSD